MTESGTSSEILKTDRRGRVRHTAQRREQLLAEFEKSGMSAPQYAEVTGLRYSTFANWRQKRRLQSAALAPGASVQAQTVEWLETVIDKAQASAPVSSSTLIVRLPSGAAIELAHVSQASVAAALLRAWEKASC